MENIRSVLTYNENKLKSKKKILKIKGRIDLEEKYKVRGVKFNRKFFNISHATFATH
jgi:hypothetical protein